MEADTMFLRRHVGFESLQSGEEIMMSAGGNSGPFPLLLGAWAQSIIFVVTNAKRNIVLPIIATRPLPKLRENTTKFEYLMQRR